MLDKAQAIIAQRYRAGAPTLTSPARTAEFLKIKLGGLDYEIFGFLALDARHRLIEYVELFRGTIDGAAVYPREVVKEALARNSAAGYFFIATRYVSFRVSTLAVLTHSGGSRATAFRLCL